MLTAKQFSEKLGLSDTGAYIRRMCQQKRIKGAVKHGRDWLIPERASIGQSSSDTPR